jgi:hypothetical protein
VFNNLCRAAIGIEMYWRWFSAGLTWQQGARSFSFWIIVAVLFVSSVGMNGAITHLDPRC